MANAKLIIVEYGKDSRELPIFGDVTTFGRTSDNSVSFAADGNVSRYHAQIERRGEDFFVSDFGSSNGTTVNGAQISGERKLNDGDKICFGGDSHVFLQIEQPEDEYEPGFSAPENSGANPKSETANPKSGGMPVMMTAATVLSGLAIVSVAAVAVVLYSTSGCQPEAVFLSPASGSTIAESTEIKLKVKNPQCIERVAFLLDGEEIASAETAPFSVTLEPENFKQFDDDASHVLSLAIVERGGAKKRQKEEILLAFGKSEVDDEDKPAPNQPPTGDPAQPQPTRETASNISLADTKTLSEQLLKQFAGNTAYKFDPQFLREVQKKTAEYKSEGYTARAAQFKDAINLAFVGEQGLDVPLGYILAMSRSKFENKAAGGEEGLWRMTNDFAASNGYNGQCGTETLSDNRQQCAARAAAIYSKALIVNLFQGDIVYGVSCYGLSPSEAGQFQVSLPPDRADFWNLIKNPKQRDAVARFFAAGIVAENPQKFGLKRDKPLSSLYKNLLILK